LHDSAGLVSACPADPYFLTCVVCAPHQHPATSPQPCRLSCPSHTHQALLCRRLKHPLWCVQKPFCNCLLPSSSSTWWKMQDARTRATCTNMAPTQEPVSAAAVTHALEEACEVYSVTTSLREQFPPAPSAHRRHTACSLRPQLQCPFFLKKLYIVL
jgi:hypothetical protein